MNSPLHVISTALLLSALAACGSSDTSSTDTETDGSSPSSDFDITINENAALRINEIVAKDVSGGADWIELYVTGTSSVNLSDYHLADENNELVQLPNVTVHSGEFYRLYASKDETLSFDSEVVAFQLGSNDEVNLYLGDELVDNLSWNKGDALIGTSFGRFPDGSDNTKTLPPSANSTNTLAAEKSLVISEVQISDQQSWFELYNNSADTINLANYSVINDSDEAEIQALPSVELAAGEYVVIYTTAAESIDTTNYSVSLNLTTADELSLELNDETIDYLSWDESDVISGYSVGVTSFAYGAEREFLSPTPAQANQVVSAFDPSKVSNLYVNISDSNWQSILSNPTAEQYHETAITLNGITLNSVAIRTKGGSSLRSVANSSSDRYSFKVDINEYVDGQKFFGLKKFTLQNSYNDPSYMREVIAYDLLSEMGVPTPQHSYVNLYINNELFGFYLMVEAVDGEFLENHFDHANGDMYKPDGTGSDLVYLGNNISSYSDINPQTNEETTDHGAFLNFVASLDAGETTSIDVDGLLRYMAVAVSLSNLDSYFGSLAHNYYLYERDGLFSLLPWDLNESFGTFNMNCSSDVRGLYIDEPITGSAEDRPLVGNVFANDDYLATYHNYLWQLIDGPLESDAFAERVNNIAALIDQHVQNDPSGFYSYSQFQQNLNTTVSRFYGLTSFIDYRVSNMKQQLLGEIPSASSDGSGYCGSSFSGRP